MNGLRGALEDRRGDGQDEVDRGDEESFQDDGASLDVGAFHVEEEVPPSYEDVDEDLDGHEASTDAVEALLLEDASWDC